ncbi:MAG: transcriptional repressor [Halieaceae bacterium]|jgi:Fur family transcriptional regulator, zinc uptake regulator|nr:transcriptional repressor [Halieaceae bacterium]
MSDSMAYVPHNHLRCIEKALDHARLVCRIKKVRFTPLRELVLELVWQSHKPVGAYALMESLRGRYEGKVAPPTVYRALDFLQEQELVHRLATLNAYIGCSCITQKGHHPSFFICSECQNAMEVDTPRISQAIRETAGVNGFSAEGNAVEVMGICNPCRKLNRRPAQGELSNQWPSSGMAAP